MRGHYEPDDQSYVDPKELAAWAVKDPIEAYKKKLLRDGVLTPADIELIEQRVQGVIQRAIEFADGSPFPESAELLADVYA